MKHALRILVAAVSMSLVMSTTPAVAAPEEETVSNAYLHLDEAMDEWASAPALRMPSSYHGGPLDSWDNSVTYDNALVIIAYANRKDNADSLDRAKTMGDALLQMQAKDPIGDGRVRNAYGPERLLRETSDTRGRGGFTGGYKSDGTKIEWKSTEHNVDMVGLFGMLHQLTKDRKWHSARKHARKFVKSMWDEKEGRFHIGTKPDGITTNRDEYIPEDVQSWGYLALRSDRYRQALDWNIANLEVTDKSNPSQPVVGVRFAWQINPDYKEKNDDTVWLEGTAHMALALRVSGKKKHKQKAGVYLDSIHKEQLYGPNADGKGIQANSREGFSGGDDKNHTSLHTGTTAWYIMAKQELNPFHLAKN